MNTNSWSELTTAYEALRTLDVFILGLGDASGVDSARHAIRHLRAFVGKAGFADRENVFPTTLTVIVRDADKEREAREFKERAASHYRLLHAEMFG